MKVHILTIFPEIFKPILKTSILGRAKDQGAIEYVIHNLRKWTSDKHKSVDDRPYGGGAGMIMKVDIVYKAVREIKSKSANNATVILMTPKGETLNQTMSSKISKLEEIILICPRYEGIDYRVAKHISDLNISIGDYVLSGGELPALVLIDSVVRLIPGVLGNKESSVDESFSDPENSIIEYPQYTRPEVFNNWKVPKVLLEGNHAEIQKWRELNKKKK